jgi:hypothetical protein
LARSPANGICPGILECDAVARRQGARDGRHCIDGKDELGAVHAAEPWDPTTETWTTLASSAGIPRVYHSAALLLPDGRVLSIGGNGYPETEVYSPPCLFKGTRPTITSAPVSMKYGQSFTVQTPNAAAIDEVRMIRLTSVTHAFNMSQYIFELNIGPIAKSAAKENRRLA